MTQVAEEELCYSAAPPTTVLSTTAVTPDPPQTKILQRTIT